MASKNAVLHPGPNRATSTTPSLDLPSPLHTVNIPFSLPTPACVQRVRWCTNFTASQKKKRPTFFYSFVGAPSLFPRFGSRLITRLFWTMIPKGPDPDPQNERGEGQKSVCGPDRICFSAGPSYTLSLPLWCLLIDNLAHSVDFSCPLSDVPPNGATLDGSNFLPCICISA